MTVLLRLWCCLSGVVFHTMTLWKPIHQLACSAFEAICAFDIKQLTVVLGNI